MKIRIAKVEDASSLLNIYTPYITKTAISFELEIPSLIEFENRITDGLREFPWLVAEVDDEIVGYAYSSKHRSRRAYEWSVESSVYVSSLFHRKGIARELYQILFSILSEQGAVNVFAGITLPNEGSVEFHESQGFSKIGVFNNVGYKFDRWHDVGWWQKELAVISKPNDLIPFEMLGK